FVMPAGYNQANLPKPNDSGVNIKTTGEEYVAALRFGGFASDKRIAKHSEKLKNLLKSKGISTSGNYKYLGYNPPFRLVGRRNEIVVSVAWAKNK
ncbi:MAG: SOUL family heme-binding protein, partial [Bacteroidales bacterium]